MKNTIDIAVAYYTALEEKKLEEVKRYLHPNIHFTDPQEQVIGKEAVLKAAAGFSAIFKSLTIRAKFIPNVTQNLVFDCAGIPIFPPALGGPYYK